MTVINNFKSLFMNIVHYRVWSSWAKHPKSGQQLNWDFNIELNSKYFFCVLTDLILYNAPSIWEALLKRDLIWFSKFSLLPFCIPNTVSDSLGSRTSQQNLDKLLREFFKTDSDIFPGLKSCNFHRTILKVSRGLHLSFVWPLLG